MVRRFLGLCLLIISFTFCTLSSIALKGPSKLGYNSYQGFDNISKPILHHEEKNQGTVGRVQHYMGNHVMKLESSEKGKKGKGTGVYGGANAAHRPRPYKSAAHTLPSITTPSRILTMIIAVLQLV